MDLKNFFVCAIIPSNDDIISAGLGMKTSVENYIFWFKIGSGFEEPGGTVPPRIPRSTPPHPHQAKPPISFFFMFAHTQRITRNSLKSSSNLWRCGALNNIEFNYGKPESKENFCFYLSH